jgi:hypothetical protein
VDIIRLLFAYTHRMSRYDRPTHQVYCYFFKRGGWEVPIVGPASAPPGSGGRDPHQGPARTQKQGWFVNLT